MVKLQKTKNKDARYLAIIPIFIANNVEIHTINFQIDKN